MFNPLPFLLFLVAVVIPAYYMNKWMLRITKPRDSFPRLFLYIGLSVLVAVLYSALFIFLWLRFYPLPKK